MAIRKRNLLCGIKSVSGYTFRVNVLAQMRDMIANLNGALERHDFVPPLARNGWQPD
jgi:hypothetical protein